MTFWSGGPRLVDQGQAHVQTDLQLLVDEMECHGCGMLWNPRVIDPRLKLNRGSRALNALSEDSRFLQVFMRIKALVWRVLNVRITTANAAHEDYAAEATSS